MSGTDQNGLTGRTSEQGGHYHNGSWFTDAECRCALTAETRQSPDRIMLPPVEIRQVQR